LAKEVVCVDPSFDLIKHGKAYNNKQVTYELGDVDFLKNFESNSVDTLLALNVLAYMNAEENNMFYSEARRILTKDGYVIVTHSNELFDMFTFNSLTKTFFEKYFATDITLFGNFGSSEIVETYITRENPLEYPTKMRKMGFTEVKQEFFRYHSSPPRLLTAESRRSPGDTSLERIPQDWRRMFQCSTYGSLLRRSR